MGKDVRMGSMAPTLRGLSDEARSPVTTRSKSRPMGPTAGLGIRNEGVLGVWIELGVRENFLEEVAHRPRPRGGAQPWKLLI